MKNDDDKLKKDFKARLYKWVVGLLKFVDKLPKGVVSKVLGKQLMRSTTSILVNYIETPAASFKKNFTNFFITHSSRQMNNKLNLLYCGI